MRSFMFIRYVVRKCGSLVLTGPVLLCSLAASAQQDSIRRLSEVEVNATPIPKVKTITPAQQISASEIRRYSAFNVADAIRNFSGVNIRDYGGIGGLKTVSVRSLGANHTSVQLDGVQVTDSQNGQIDLGNINLDNVSDITLHNGQPGDIALPARSFASASVLVINSQAPVLKQDKPYQIRAGIKTGSFGLINPSLQWQQRLNEKLSFSFTNSLIKAHGRYKYKVDGDGSDTLAVRDNAGVNTVQSDASVFWVPDSSSRLQVRANINNSDRGLPGAVVYYNPYTNQSLRGRDIFVQSSYHKHWQRFRLIFNARYADNYTRYLDPDFLNSAGVLDQRYQQREWYGSGVAAVKLRPNLELAYSSDISRSTLTTNLYNYSYPVRFTYLNALSSLWVLGGLKVQGTLLNTIVSETVNSGLAAADRSAWSPTIMLSYQPRNTSSFLFRAFYKDIFRNPTFNDLYYTRIGNRNLRPEYAEQYNAGVTFEKTGTGFLDFMTLTADAYYNKVTDKIIAIPNKDLFSWSMLNLGEVDIRGLDLGIKSRGRLTGTSALLLSANYTFQSAVDATDRNSSYYLDQIPYTPQHTLAVNTGVSASKWGIYYNQVYSSGRYYLSENLPQYFVPGFLVSDLSVNYSFGKTMPVSLSAEVNNVFNTSYALIRSFPMPGRSLRLSLQIII